MRLRTHLDTRFLSARDAVELVRRDGLAPTLSGIARCGCGYALTTSAANGEGGKYFYYRCVGLQKNAPKHPCDVRQIRAHELEREVMSIVRDAARPCLIHDDRPADLRPRQFRVVSRIDLEGGT